MKKIKVEIVPKKLNGFYTKPQGFALEVQIGTVRLISQNFWLREQDAIRRAKYIADKLGVKIED